MQTRSIHVGRGLGSPAAVPLSLMVCCALAAPAAAQVTVDGGRNAVNPVMYEWTVVNANANGARLVSFWTPHHPRVENFEPPDGWECEVVDKVKPETDFTVRALEFRASDRRSALRAGQSNVFKLLVTMDKATPQSGYAVVEFDDGTAQLIANVEIPGYEPWLRRYALGIGFGVMFAVFLLVQAIRSLGKPPAGEPAAPPSA